MLHVFTKDEAVIAVAQPILRICGGLLPFVLSALVLTQALFGAGNTKFVMFVEFGLHFFCLVPLAYFFGVVLDWGVIGVWMGAFAYILLLCTLMGWKFAAGLLEGNPDLANVSGGGENRGAARIMAYMATLLIVDDEPNILSTLRRALELEGYAVEVAGAGRIALEKAKRARVRRRSARRGHAGDGRPDAAQGAARAAGPSCR